MNLSLAIVRDIADPSAAGRVKVSLSGAADTAAVWAPLASPFAGDGRGLFLMPEVGDEVVVGFLDDAGRSPVVLGALWTARSPPPTANPKERVLRSSDGHRIRLVDSPDPAQSALVIEDAHGSRIEMRPGHLLIRTDGQLDIQGKAVAINGKPV